ncbi:hypothetical protein [Streptomyces sp. NPDC057557]|uniref:hypothetical protein n=1 Tax=Streptomyces sp. NPDC057557 TaxID=3346167 RepID=UPI003688CB59
MRATSIGAVLTGALVLSASAVTATAAYAAETGVLIQEVSVNGGKPIVLGASQTESFTISVTAPDDSGISSKLAFFQIKREVGDKYWSYHGTPTCTASSATTSTCKLTFKLDSGWGVPRNTLAGPWKVVVQLKSKDGDLYNNGGDITHPVLRRGKLSVDAGRHDILRPDQADAVTGRKKPHVSVRGPIQPVEAEVLLRVWGDGGVNTGDAAQRQALEDLVAADMVTRGDMSDVLPDRVAYSLRMLSEPSPPTDTPHVADHWHLASSPTDALTPSDICRGRKNVIGLATRSVSSRPMPPGITEHCQRRMAASGP